MAFIVRRPSFGTKRVAPLQERNPEAEAGVKGATRLSSSREDRPANGEGSSAFRQENQAFPWKRLIQRIVEPLPVERASAWSRRRSTLDAGRSLVKSPFPGRPRSVWWVGWCFPPGPPFPPSLTNRGVANTRERRIG